MHTKNVVLTSVAALTKQTNKQTNDSFTSNELLWLFPSGDAAAARNSDAK
jgi:hypothetical protein